MWRRRRGNARRTASDSLGHAWRRTTAPTCAAVRASPAAGAAPSAAAASALSRAKLTYSRQFDGGRLFYLLAYLIFSPLTIRKRTCWHVRCVVYAFLAGFIC
uniref:Uncharacterized protein n=1 Tax=Zea mays TaxID=4577 RepID=A0A804MIB9_MAIZE